MKYQILIDVPQPVIKTPCQTSQYKYYGAIINKTPVLIIQHDFDMGKFYPVCSSQLTRHNSYVDRSGNTIQEVVANILRGGGEVYEFDTPKELFTWLSQQSYPNDD